MPTPKNGDTVSIDYVLRRSDGEVVGTTEEQIFPQIEQALTAMEVGDEETVAIECDSAFGPRRDELIIEIPRENLPPEPAPQPGMALQAQQQDGSPMTLYVVDVNDQSIKADGNHPLAGEDITFAITLREIKQAA